jgi:hypothetical protein
MSAGLLGGGGIFHTGSLILDNSTISGNNTNNDGGGLWFSGGAAEIRNATIAYNIADEDGDGSGLGGGFNNTGVMTFYNSIIAINSKFSNTTQVPDDCVTPGGTTISGGYNLVGMSEGCSWDPAAGDQLGANISPIDPRLGPLANNGGGSQSHSLLPGSPAIDTGNPTIPGSSGNACLLTDQRYTVRPESTACDIGSYEAVEMTEIALFLPASAEISSTVVITSVVIPFRSATPITSTWQADDQVTINKISGITDVVTYTWQSTGNKTISIAAENGISSASTSMEIFIFDIAGAIRVYLPIVEKERVN